MKHVSLQARHALFAVLVSLLMLGGCSKTFMCHLNGTQCPAQKGAAAPSGGGGGGGGGGGEESSGESGESSGNEAPSSESSEPSSSESSESSSESSGEQPAAAAPRDCKPLGAVVDNVHDCCSDSDKLTPDHTAHVCCDHDSDSSCS